MNERSFEVVTVKQAAGQVHWRVEMEERLVKVWQQHDCLYNICTTTVQTKRRAGKNAQKAASAIN